MSLLAIPRVALCEKADGQNCYIGLRVLYIFRYSPYTILAAVSTQQQTITRFYSFYAKKPGLRCVRFADSSLQRSRRPDCPPVCGSEIWNPHMPPLQRRWLCHPQSGRNGLDVTAFAARRQVSFTGGVKCRMVLSNFRSKLKKMLERQLRLLKFQVDCTCHSGHKLRSESGIRQK